MREENERGEPMRLAASMVVLATAGLSLGTGGAMLLLPSTAIAQKEIIVDVKVVQRGFRASKLKGTNVVNDKNEKIGEINDIMIGRDRSVFAILEVGGFLGIGEHLVAVPWESLSIDEKGTRVVLKGATRESLKQMPQYRHTT
jgi:sporulation protein YlmC with PRC-barrel domain